MPRVMTITIRKALNSSLGAGIAATAASLYLGMAAASAQQPPPQPWSMEQSKQQPGQKGPAPPQPPAKAPTSSAPAASSKSSTGSPKAATKEDGASGTRSTETALRQRVEQLEEQLADLQVTIGTLESLSKGSAGAQSAAPIRAGGGASSAADQARIDSLETQLRALSAQVEQLTNQVRQNARRGDAAPLGDAPGGRPDLADARPAGSAGSAGGFGSMTVKPGGNERDRDQIGKLLNPDAAQPVSGAPLPPAAANAGNPKELYETAYGYLLQQDYGAAEVAFEEFLRRYPSDRQTADAQYWYAETLYVQRRYKPAAQAFLKVIERHQASSKVPNSLLKVAMALEQLGQKDCALFNELDTRHPNAPADVKTKARAVKQRMGC